MHPSWTLDWLRPGRCVACRRGPTSEQVLTYGHGLGLHLPRLGEVYTLREIVLNEDHHQPVVRLAEIVNPALAWRGGRVLELAFAAGMFRPLPITSIEQFRRLQRPVRELV